MTKVLPKYRNSMIAIGLAMALTACEQEAQSGGAPVKSLERLL
ncbi:hypothetical protein ACFSJQ_23145 [Vibrio olivae]